MVDPHLSASSAEKSTKPSTAAASLGSSEEEPADGGGADRSPVPLLQRIVRDRQDLEAKIDKLRGYISASSDMMTKLKNIPDMKDRYESLSATRADLVQNAVNLQQLLVKIKASESRAAQLAGRERALAAETSARTQADFAEVARELPPERVAELDPEDLANYERKLDLMKRINQSQEKLKAMEAEQQRLRLLKENVEWKLAEARAGRAGLQEQARELLHDMPGVHPAADATNWESTTAPDRSALETLNDRVAALQSVPVELLDADAAQELRQRLQALAEKRLQLDAMQLQLQQLQRQSAEEEARPAEPPPPPPTGDGADSKLPQEQQDQDQTVFLEEHVAAMQGQRQRLQELEATVQSIKETLAVQPGQSLSPEEQERVRQERECSQQLLLEQEQSLRRREQEVNASRQQLTRLKQLMTSVEEAHSSGQRLTDAVPHQLTELLASVHQLEKQHQQQNPQQQQQQTEQHPQQQQQQQDQHSQEQQQSDDGEEEIPGDSEAETASAAALLIQPDRDSQSRAEEYVTLLRSLQDSADSIEAMQRLDQ